MIGLVDSSPTKWIFIIPILAIVLAVSAFLGFIRARRIQKLAEEFGLSYANNPENTSVISSGVLNPISKGRVYRNQVWGTVGIHSVEFYDLYLQVGLAFRPHLRIRTRMIVDGQSKDLHGLSYRFVSVRRLRGMLSGLKSS